MRSLLRAGWSAFQVQMKMRVVDPMSYAGLFFFPLVMTVISLYVIGASQHASRAPYAILGGALTGFWTYTFFDAGASINQERWSGTLELIVSCPTPLAVIVLGKAISAMLVGIIGFLPVVAVSYLWGARLPALEPGPVVISFAVMVAAFFAVGMMLAPLYPLARWIFPLVNGLEIFVYLVCGFMFPVSQLPGWTQVLSSALPTTWGVAALYGSLSHTGKLAPAWALTVALSAGYLLLSWRLFRIVEKRARVSGQLSSA